LSTYLELFVIKEFVHPSIDHYLNVFPFDHSSFCDNKERLKNHEDGFI